MSLLRSRSGRNQHEANVILCRAGYDLFETNRDGIGFVAVADGEAGLLNKGRAAALGSPHLWSVYCSLTCADNSNRGGSPHERADRNLLHPPPLHPLLELRPARRRVLLDSVFVQQPVHSHPGRPMLRRGHPRHQVRFRGFQRQVAVIGHQTIRLRLPIGFLARFS